MTPSDVFRQATDWIELAKARANPEHDEHGGWRRQTIPVDAGTLRDCLDVAPMRVHPAWASFRDGLLSNITGRIVLIRVTDAQTILAAMTPPAIAVKEKDNG